MYNRDTELLFPPRVIPTLSLLRGEIWRQLVESVQYAESSNRERMAFVLLMIRLAGCASCHADTFRALRGCTQCARQAVRRFRGDEDQLMQMFTQARQEVSQYLNENGA